MKPQNQGALLVFLSALMFGSYGAWSRLIGPAMGNFYQGWTRGLIILLVLIPIVLWRKEIVRIKKKDWGWLAIFLFCTSLTQAPLFYAFNHMDIGSATLLFFVSMFFTINVVGVVVYKETLTKEKILSALLALLGMYLVFSFSVAAFLPFAALMALVNGMASGGEIAFSKKLTDHYSPLFVTTLSWGIILVTNSLLSLALGEPQIAFSFTQPWLFQIGYSIAGLLGFWLVIAGFKQVDATVGSLLGLLEIVFGIAFGILIFGEVLSPSVTIGAILIILAAAFPHLSPVLKKKEQAP